MVEVVYSDDAKEWLANADPDAQTQVLKRVQKAQDFPDHILDRYTGASEYKLRAGEYRVIVDWRQNADPEFLYIRRIGHRDGFYD